MERSLRIWLEDVHGVEVEYEVIGSFALEEKMYMVLFRVGNTNTSEVDLIGFHAGEDDEIIFDPIEDEELYKKVSEAFFETFNEKQPPLEEAELEEDDYCYEDDDGNLFIFDENGEKIFLDENGEPK